MAGKVVPFRRSLDHYPAPGSLFTLEEVRARMETPREADAVPPSEVSWRVFTLVPRREVTVRAQRWWDARLMGALQLGLLPERVSCVRADEVRIGEVQEDRLEGNSVA